MPSLLDKIGEMLKPAPPAAPAQNTTPGVAGQIQQNVAQNKADSEPNPGKTAAPGANTSDQQQSVWAQRPAEDPSAKRVFNSDMKQFNEAVAQMDFVKGADPQLVAKALQGDTEAFQQVLNSAARNAFAQSALSSRDLMEHALAERTKDMEKLINQRFTALRAGERVAEQNPAFKDPTVAPLLKDIQSRMQAQFPEASAEELAAKSQEFLLGIATQITQQSPAAREAAQKQQQAATQTADFNWENWATLPAPQSQQ